jgi:ectoine hydroxylase-related dioxygenase (phytanoyl-CoA dioxygenase family)
MAANTMTTTAPMISDAQLRRLDEDGFFLLEDVFTRAEMDDLTVRIEEHQRRHEAAIVAKDGVEGISRAKEITFTSHLAEQDPAIDAFVRRPEFVAITTQLLGPDVDLYWNQSVFKAPEGFREFPWHQDDGYQPVDPSPYLTLWLALSDATEENGTISALPGSHLRGLLPHEKTPIGLACHGSDDPDQGVVVPVPAGAMAVFWSLTAHKSGVNRSAATRKAYVIQYAPAGLRKAATGEVIPGLVPIARGGVGV